MIFLLILLDVLINNYTKYTSYFFIVYLYNKPYKFYLLTALILDFIIFNTLFYNTIILTIMYFFNKIFKDLNKNNFYNFIFISIFNYIIFIILTSLINFQSISAILTNIGMHLIINLLFYILSFRVVKINKNVTRRI